MTVVTRLANSFPQTADLQVADRVATAAKIYALVRQYFAHYEGVPVAAVERAYRAYTERARRTKSRKEFDLATLEFIATLRNGHTQFSDSAWDST